MGTKQVSVHCIYPLENNKEKCKNKHCLHSYIFIKWPIGQNWIQPLYNSDLPFILIRVISPAIWHHNRCKRSWQQNWEIWVSIYFLKGSVMTETVFLVLMQNCSVAFRQYKKLNLHQRHVASNKLGHFLVCELHNKVI